MVRRFDKLRVCPRAPAGPHPVTFLVSRRAFGAATLGTIAFGAQAGPAEIMARAKPSIVAVGTYRATDSPRFQFRGSGFAVGDGTRVVTCFHVLPEAGSDAAMVPLAVLLPRGPDGGAAWRQASVESTDRAHDIAVLKIEGAALPALALADATAMQEGAAVALIGFPVGGVLGYAPVIHRGMVSAVTPMVLPTAAARQLDERAIRALRGTAFDIYQLDAVAFPGNSGGPLFDADSGRVIGVVNMGLVKANRETALSQPSGITYAIPVRHALALLEGKRPGAP